MPKNARILTSDEIDDLIYFARTGDLDSLKESIEATSRVKSCTTFAVIKSAIDVDDEGLGSGSCLLHYPAANGNLAIVQYLLSQLSDPAATSIQNGELQGENNTLVGSDGAAGLVNHQNVSGNTPLHWAGMNGHLEVVKALVKAGADPGVVNGAGRDAVFESDVSSKEGAAECAVEMLRIHEGLEKGSGESAAANGGAMEGAEDDERISQQARADADLVLTEESLGNET